MIFLQLVGWFLTQFLVFFDENWWVNSPRRVLVQKCKNFFIAHSGAEKPTIGRYEFSLFTKITCLKRIPKTELKVKKRLQKDTHVRKWPKSCKKLLSEDKMPCLYVFHAIFQPLVFVLGGNNSDVCRICTLSLHATKRSSNQRTYCKFHDTCVVGTIQRLSRHLDKLSWKSLIFPVNGT